MSNTVTTTMGNDNDDWEVAVDTGEFDKRLEQQEKARAANQESVISSVSSTVNDDDSRNSSGINLMASNKPIRILKRPTSQSQLPTNNDVTKSSITATTTTTTTAINNNNNTNKNNLPSVDTISSSTTVPVVSIIPRIQTKDSTNSSQSITTPSSTSSPSQSTKPAIKTYEQRELEYRLARLRIMGEEESSVKDDDNLPVAESTSVPIDDTTKPTTSSSSSSTFSITRTMNQMSGPSQQPLQCHSTPGSYASNLYALNNVPSNTGTIHFMPNNSNNNNNNNSTPNLGTGPFSSPNIPQNYRGAYPVPYSHIPPPTGMPRYPLTATTTTTLYMTSTAPFVSAPSSSISSSYHYPPQQHSNMTTNNWYSYQHSQAPSGAQQFGHPQ